jgi:hypothetical protein
MRLARSDSIRPHSADRSFYNPDENKCSFYDMKLRWFLLLAFCLDVCEVFLPAVIPPASNGLERVAQTTAIVGSCFAVLLIGAVAKYRSRGLRVLLFLPPAAYWPLGFAVLHWGCAHHVTACP